MLEWFIFGNSVELGEWYMLGGKAVGMTPVGESGRSQLHLSIKDAPVRGRLGGAKRLSMLAEASGSPAFTAAPGSSFPAALFSGLFDHVKGLTVRACSGCWCGCGAYGGGVGRPVAGLCRAGGCQIFSDATVLRFAWDTPGQRWA
jgi:hypothetical protein